MAQNTYKSNTFKKSEKEKKGKSSQSKFSLEFLKDPRLKLASGFFLLALSAYLGLSFISYLFTGTADHSVVKDFGSAPLVESGTETENWLGWGTFLILIFSLFVFIIFYFNITSIPAFQTKDPKPV